MGVLIAKKYPTKLFLNSADHTYVECGTGGKGWSCWGGKTGGTAFNSGTGSTNRADRIAQPNERAGITIYLVNGVCHQAANRVLLPAGILVTAARGYSVSSALFGPYGKPASFNQYPGVSGDLPLCVPRLLVGGPISPPVAQLQKGEGRHFRSILMAYRKFDSAKATPLEGMRFQGDLFDMEVSFRLGKINSRVAKGLRLAKEKVELEHWLLAEGLTRQNAQPAQFINGFNRMTIQFQDDIAAVLNKTQYVKLMNLRRDEQVLLADPDIIRAIYGDETVREVYPNLQ